ncbi:MAG TPA: hypothetical protein VG734_18170 [Lacunisphaera sp.]|nr:hypothetical protein [Lacunisphaera sp.]
MKTLRFPLIIGVLAAAGIALFAQMPEPVITAATGLDYSRGSYGFPTDTEVTAIPLDLGYEAGPWTWRANLSHLTIKGPAAIVGDGGVPRPTTGTESGIGDIYLSGTYRAGPVVGGVNLDSTVRVKLPTANEARGLGTGETDYYAQLDAYRTYGRVTPFASGGYRFLGANATYALRDGAYASAGAHFRASPATVLTASYGWGERLLATGSHTEDATVMVTHDVSQRWRVMGYAMTGFTDASPDFGAGARLTCRF